MLTKETIMDALGNNLDSIRKYGVDKIGLFGSYIREEQTDGSDIDLLVEFRNERVTFEDYMGLLIYLEDLLGKKVDLTIPETLKPELRDKILGSVRYVS